MLSISAGEQERIVFLKIGDILLHGAVIFDLHSKNWRGTFHKGMR